MRRLALFVYQLALLAFPSKHRSVYGREMVEMFELTLAARRSVFPLLTAACLDAIRAGLGERRRYQRRSAFAFIGRDLGHAIRALMKAPTFCLVSVLSIGIGIGTVIGGVTIMRGMMATPPGVVVDGLVEILVIPKGSLLAQSGKWAIETWTYPDFVELQNAAKGMTITGWSTDESTVRLKDGESVRMDAAYVSPNYFTTLGIALARGPGFNQSERSNPPEAIIRYDVWQNRFGADPDIIGSSIVVNGVPYVIAGVAPEDFRGHLAPHRHSMDKEGPGFELWLPLSQHPRLIGAETVQFKRNVDWLRIMGRLNAGTSLVEANGTVSSLMAGLAEHYPANNALKSASVEPYFSMGARQRLDMQLERATWLMVCGLVLLVVCLNVSGMVLVRTATRERELAVRLAVGASRVRLMQYLLAESLIVATLGGTLGAFVVFGVPAAVTWWFGQPLELGLQPDATIIAISAGLCFVTSLIFGMLPAVRFSRPRIISALKDDAFGGGRRVGRIHRATAMLQAGFAVPFLVMSGVMLDQVRTTAFVDLGFQPSGLYLMPLNLAVDGHDDDSAFMLHTALGNLERASGVASVTVADGFPLDSNYRVSPVARDGAEPSVRATTTRVSPRFLETAKARLLRGRDVLPDDRMGTERVVVISEPLATQLFPNAEPLGQQVKFALGGETANVYTIIGVTADLVASHLGSAQPQLFVPLAQHPSSNVFVIARSTAPAAVMTPVFENAFVDFKFDPGVVRSRVQMAEEYVRRNRNELVMLSVATAAVGLVALLLAALGVFGVIGFIVASRTREIGIRIALGASRSNVLSGVLWDAVKLVLPGVIGGSLLTIPLVNEVSVYSLGIVEPLAYIIGAGASLGIGLLASLPAARRAAAVEPTVAMRAE